MRLSPLMSMSDVRRAAILRRWLAMRNAPMPSRDALERIWQEVALARDDASPCLRFGDHEIRRYQSQLWWIKSVAGQHETTVAWPVWQTPLALPAGLGRYSSFLAANCADRERKNPSAFGLKRQGCYTLWDVTADVN